MKTRKAVSLSPQDRAYHKYVTGGHSVNDLITWFRSELSVHPKEKEKYDH